MKKCFKIILLNLFLMVLLPNIVNAAGLSLVKAEQLQGENYVKYNIVYDATDATETSVKIDINPAGEGIEYELMIAEGIINQKESVYSYTINVEGIEGSNIPVATLKITNVTTETKSVIPSIMGTYSATLGAIELNGVEPEPEVTTTTTTTTQSVPNNNLSGLDISVGVMDKTFSKDVTEYNITEIKDTINSITLTPTCETDCNWNVTCPLGECSVTNPTKNARISLQTGANKVSIVVESIDKSINKTYILNVYRGEIETSSAYLSDIKIKDVELSPKFDSLNNSYSTIVGLDVDSLEIETIAEDPDAKIVIKGNENFKEGLNTVTITVTSSDNENKQVYTIEVTKEEIEEEKEEEEEIVPVTKVEKKDNNLWLIIGISSGALIIIIVVAIILFRKKKNNKNKKNDKNDRNGGSKIKDNSASDLINNIEKENTDSLNILNETRKQMSDEPKQDIDEALDDLMMTKRLEFGDLGL